MFHERHFCYLQQNEIIYVCNGHQLIKEQELNEFTPKANINIRSALKNATWEFRGGLKNVREAPNIQINANHIEQIHH